MKGCSVCGSSDKHLSDFDCIGYLLARLAEAEKRYNDSFVDADKYDNQQSHIESLESRLRDAEAALGEYRRASNQLGSKEMFTGMAGAAKLKILDSLPTTGAYDRLRNEVLEEAAKIAENSCLSPPDGGSPTAQEVESAEYAARLIRAAKKEVR